MNNSGMCIREITDYHRIKTNNIFVFHDVELAGEAVAAGVHGGFGFSGFGSRACGELRVGYVGLVFGEGAGEGVGSCLRFVGHWLLSFWGGIPWFES